jgi:UDP:flavonoid glycosyltransferase YjiC (YdhE family)
MKDHAVFKRGPTDPWPARFYHTAIAACRKLGMRGLLLDGTPPGIDLPSELIWRPFVPLDRALENARVVVYNGGIGTASAAIACGVPQVIVPRWFDQARNAEWMRRLGVAAVIPPERFTPEALCRQLDWLTGRGGHRKRALELSARIDSHAASARFCEFLEGLPASETGESKQRQV